MRSSRMFPRWIRPTRPLVVGLLAAILASIWTTGAGAQTPGARFTYELCDPALPGGSPPPLTFLGSTRFAPFQNCSLPGGAVGLQESGPLGPGTATADATVEATPGGFVESEAITAYTANMLRGNRSSHVVVEGWPPQDGGEHTRIFPLRGASSPCGDCAGGGGFEISLSCNFEEKECEQGAQIGARYVAATEVDPVAPVLGAVEGPLLAGGPRRGHQILAATASDVGGGLSVLEVFVNGILAPGAVPGACAATTVSNPSYHGVAAYSPTPCPPTLNGTWSLETAAPPFHQGANLVQVCASDFATTGPPNTTCSPVQTVDVDDSCTESSVGGGQNLDADFEGSGGEAVTVPFEEPAEVVGDVTSATGTPIAGATVCVRSQVQESGGEPQDVATVVTDATGHFVYDVPAGPDRRLLLGYRSDAFQVEKTLTFASHVKPQVTLDHGRIRRGGRIGITGTLPGPGAAGRVVVLQASSLHGTRWLTFRRATTGPNGGFRASYRFGKTSGTTTYRIRAAVPRQADYPWEPGHSTPRRIKVFVPRAGRHAKSRKPTTGRHRKHGNRDKRNSHTHGGKEA